MCEVQINTQNLKWCISTLMEAFLNQKSILFWLKKTSVSIKTYQLSFRVFICTSHLETLDFFQKEFPPLMPIFLFHCLFVDFSYYSLHILYLFPFKNDLLRIGNLHIWRMGN